MSRSLFSVVLLVALAACAQRIESADPDGGEPDADLPPDAALIAPDAATPRDASVGTCETGCMGFNYCDPGQGKCVAGCNRDADCTGGKCETDHSCTCPQGFHLCGGQCASDTSPLSCGSRCVACPTGGGMTAGCVNGACTLDCQFPAYRCLSGCCTLTAGPGGNHTCAPGPDGGVLCWGDNFSGGLGDGRHGTDAGTPSPVPSSNLGGTVARVVSGYDDHSCALDGAGSVWCWGFNLFGGVGDGTRYDVYAPKKVASSGFFAVAAGANHSCAVTLLGGVKCWGKNDYGQVGNNDTPNPAYSPVAALPDGSDVEAVTAGTRNSCALTRGGALKCWGTDSAGQMGDDGFTQRNVPFDVPGMGANVVSVSLGDLHVCAALKDGSVKCWGFDNQCSRLGDGTATTQRHPKSVVGLTEKIVQVAAGAEHTCALADSGRVFCWGCNEYGQLGNGDTSGKTQPSPVQVQGLGTNAAAIFAGFAHTCAVLKSGSLMCWGANDRGQIGDGTIGADAVTPMRVKGY